MLVSIYQDVSKEKAIIFETSLGTAKELFNYIKFTYGEEISDGLVYGKNAFVGLIGTEATALTEATLFTDLPLYEQLHIFPKIEGAEPISATAVIAASASAATAVGASAATALSMAAFMSTTLVGSITIASVVATVANIAIAIGISMAVSAIMAPDSSFQGDPSSAQKTSKMFNSSTITTEQGGSVPLTYGNPFMGGVLISSGITSADVTYN